MDLMLLVAMFAIAAVPVRAQAQQFRKRIADARCVRRARTVCGVRPTPLTGRRKRCIR